MIKSDHGWTKIVVPVRRNWYPITFLLIWLGVWWFGVFNMFAGYVDGTHDEPSIARLAGTLAMASFGLLGAYWLAWFLAGCETIWVSADRFARSWAIGPIRKTAEYDRSAIRKAFWLLPSNSEGAPADRGSIKISYGTKDVHLASDLDKTESELVLDTLTRVGGIPQK